MTGEWDSQLMWDNPFDMEVICDRNYVSIQMYLLNQCREFLTSLKVFLRGVPLASRLLYH